jgi:hypothetical protein
VMNAGGVGWALVVQGVNLYAVRNYDGYVKQLAP